MYITISRFMVDVTNPANGEQDNEHQTRTRITAKQNSFLTAINTFNSSNFMYQEQPINGLTSRKS